MPRLSKHEPASWVNHQHSVVSPHRQRMALGELPDCGLRVPRLRLSWALSRCRSSATAAGENPLTRPAFRSAPSARHAALLENSRELRAPPACSVRNRPRLRERQSIRAACGGAGRLHQLRTAGPALLPLADAVCKFSAAGKGVVVRPTSTDATR